MKYILNALLKIFFMIVLFFLLFFAYIEISLPDIDSEKDFHMQIPLGIYTSDGKLIAEFGEIKRIPITLDQVPKQLLRAVLATEDQRYYFHSGVDLLGLGRAFVILLSTGRKSEGGSTITMQVARNFFLTRKKTYLRKLQEIMLALKIERALSKEKILELYFNKIFYGNHAYGIATASQVYFGKSLDKLNLAEMALIAGLPKAPSDLNPLANLKAAADRRNHVLVRMYELGYITKAEYETATKAPITAHYYGIQPAVDAPYVAEMVRQLMVSEFGEEQSYTGGFKVYTTINSQFQNAANNSVTENLIAYDQRHGYRGAEDNIGDVDPNNLTGALEALSSIPSVNKFIPAVVIGLSNSSATVLIKSGETKTISLKGMLWARKQIIQDNKEYLGGRSKQPGDILKIGDIIRIRNVNDSWVLAQVPDAEAALVAINPNNGAVLALNGGFDFYKSTYNRVTQSLRQPGSNIKPFIYAAALDKGYTLSSVINDAPIVTTGGANNGLWRPENSTHKFYGPTRLREALYRSQNLVTIRLLQQIGIPYAVDYLTRFGFDPKTIPATLSLALGTSETSPLTLVTAYSVFANGGFLVKPYFIDHVVDEHNKTVYQSRPLQVCENCAGTESDLALKNLAPRVISQETAYLLTSAMQDVIRRGTARSALSIGRKDLAGKTGTTSDNIDAWFSGFNRNVVVTTWIGFDSPRPLYELAAKAALPMWISFMKDALNKQPETTFTKPENIVSLRVNASTGLLATPGDTRTITEYFVKGATPGKGSEAPTTAVGLPSGAVESNIEEVF